MSVTMASKVSFFCFVIAYSSLFPKLFNSANYLANFHWPIIYSSPVTLAMHFSTWDAQHFLYLSQFGYTPNTQSCAFLPLWPFLIYLFSKIFHDPLIASLILSNVFSLFADVLFFKFVQRLYGQSIARWSLLFLLSFPGALFFQFPYSESLFFLLTILFFIGFFEDNLALTCLSGLLLPLTRIVGILLLLPAAYKSLFPLQNWKMATASVASISVGVGLLLGVMKMGAGDYLANIHAQEYFVSQGSVERFFSLSGFLSAFCSVTSMHNQTHSLVDRVLFCIYLASLYSTWKLNKTFFIYSVLLGLIPVVGNYFMSATRYLTVVFPMFICAAQFFPNDKRRLYAWLLILLGLALQLFLTLWHIDNCWAG